MFNMALKSGGRFGGVVMPLEIDDYLNQTRAGEMLGVTRVTIWNWIQSGKIQSVIVGGRQLIPKSEVDRLKEERNGSDSHQNHEQ